MQGDGENQPGESDDTLLSLASLMDSEESQEETELEESEESEEVEQEEQEEEQEEEETVILKHEGKEVSVSRSEAIALAQKGYDYSSKTMAVAEERKAVDATHLQAKALVSEVSNHRDQVLQDLEAAESFLMSQVGQPPTLELLYSDPSNFYIQKELHNQQNEKLETVRSAIASQRAQQDRERQTWEADSAQRMRKELSAVKGWESFEAKGQELQKYLADTGVNADEFGDALFNPELWKTIEKARLYDVLKAKQATLKPKESLQKVVKPNGNNQNMNRTGKSEAIKRFNAKPNLNNLAAFLD